MVSSHIYIYIYLFFKLVNVPHTHIYIYIYSIGPTPKSVEYNFFRQFLELLRQFSPDMFVLLPKHIRLARHVQLQAQTCLGLRFPAYIRGLSAPLGTIYLFFLFHSSCGGQGLSR
jgi:hypothetical protein